jgi:hypothetical protein
MRKQPLNVTGSVLKSGRIIRQRASHVAKNNVTLPGLCFRLCAVASIPLLFPALQVQKPMKRFLFPLDWSPASLEFPDRLAVRFEWTNAFLFFPATVLFLGSSSRRPGES